MDRGVVFPPLRLSEKEPGFCRFAAIATKTISPGRVIRLEYGRSNLGTYLIEDTGSPTRSTGRTFVLGAPVSAKFAFVQSQIHATRAGQRATPTVCVSGPAYRSQGN